MNFKNYLISVSAIACLYMVDTVGITSSELSAFNAEFSIPNEDSGTSRSYFMRYGLLRGSNATGVYVFDGCNKQPLLSDDKGIYFMRIDKGLTCKFYLLADVIRSAEKGYREGFLQQAVDNTRQSLKNAVAAKRLASETLRFILYDCESGLGMQLEVGPDGFSEESIRHLSSFKFAELPSEKGIFYLIRKSDGALMFTLRESLADAAARERDKNTLTFVDAEEVLRIDRKRSSQLEELRIVRERTLYEMRQGVQLSIAGAIGSRLLVYKIFGRLF